MKNVLRFIGWRRGVIITGLNLDTHYPKFSYDTNISARSEIRTVTLSCDSLMLVHSPPLQNNPPHRYRMIMNDADIVPLEKFSIEESALIFQCGVQSSALTSGESANTKI